MDGYGSIEYICGEHIKKSEDSSNQGRQYMKDRDKELV